MLTGTRLQRMADRVIRRVGDGLAVTLRRRANLMNVVTGKSLNALAVHEAADIDDEQIVLEAPNLRGKLPQGVELEIQGDGTPYTVAANAEAVGGLITVTLAPPLVADAAVDAVVTLTRPYKDWTFAAVRSRSKVADVDGEKPAEGKKLHLSARGAPFAPEMGDLVVDQGENQVITKVDTATPGGTDVRYTVEIGGAS